jgi:hypothetical protein
MALTGLENLHILSQSAPLVATPVEHLTNRGTPRLRVLKKHKMVCQNPNCPRPGKVMYGYRSDKRYCSKNCYLAVYQRPERKKRVVAPVPAEDTKGLPKSEARRPTNQPHPRVYKRQCQYGGHWFMAARATTRFCSKKHNDAWRHHGDPALKAKPVVLVPGDQLRASGVT